MLNPTRTTESPTSIGLQRLRQLSNPPEIVVGDAAEAARQAERFGGGASGGGLIEKLREGPRSELISAPQSPFFFESAIGRAYLAAGVGGGQGRALAQGWPAEQCPAFGATLDSANPRAAAEAALTSCLEDLPKNQVATDCGCRLLALDEVLLAPADAFVYARGVAAMVYDPASGRSAVLVAEERHPMDVYAEIEETSRPDSLAALAKGARRLWLLSPDRPAAALDLTADGEAALVFVEGPPEALEPGRQLRGVWRSDGFRRGRRAGVARLEDARGAELLVLFGYGPDEIAARRSELVAEAERL